LKVSLPIEKLSEHCIAQPPRVTVLFPEVLATEPVLRNFDVLPLETVIGIALTLCVFVVPPKSTTASQLSLFHVRPFPRVAT